MKLAPFWVRARGDAECSSLPPVSCWGWSQRSEADAAQHARARARRLAERLAADPRGLTRRYGYGDRPLREPILREFRNDAGELVAALTRNSYGCLVLNTARFMFVDIDVPELEHFSWGAWFSGLLNRLRGRPTSSPGEAALEARLAHVEAWTRRHAGWSWRVYRTRAGLRLLATHAGFDPAAESTQTWLAELGADPLYARLCRNQESFRARLTPKPWRCGGRACPVPWPFADAAAERRFQAWERRYLQQSARAATCRFLRVIGDSTVTAEIKPLLRLHDKTTQAESSLPLA